MAAAAAEALAAAAVARVPARVRAVTAVEIIECDLNSNTFKCKH